MLHRLPLSIKKATVLALEEPQDDVLLLLVLWSVAHWEDVVVCVVLEVVVFSLVFLSL